MAGFRDPLDGSTDPSIDDRTRTSASPSDAPNVYERIAAGGSSGPASRVAVRHEVPRASPPGAARGRASNPPAPGTFVRLAEALNALPFGTRMALVVVPALVGIGLVVSSRQFEHGAARVASSPSITEVGGDPAYVLRDDVPLRSEVDGPIIVRLRARQRVKALASFDGEVVVFVEPRGPVGFVRADELRARSR